MYLDGAGDLQDPEKLNALLNSTRLIKEIKIENIDSLNEYREASASIFQKFGQYVQQLELRNVTSDDMLVWELLKLVPNLKSLNLAAVTINGLWNERNVVELSKLKKLTLVLPDNTIGAQFKAHLIKHAERSLRSFEFVGVVGVVGVTNTRASAIE